MSPEDLDRVVQIETRSYAFPWTRGIFEDSLRTGDICCVATLPAKTSTRNARSAKCDGESPCRSAGGPVSQRPSTIGDEVVGHAIVGIGAGEAHLLNACVLRDQQGHGYGRLLVRHALGLARSEGCGVVFLEVRRSNWVAAALYESLGFREIGVRRDYYKSQVGYEDARIMALDLEGFAQTRSGSSGVAGKQNAKE